MSLVNHSTAHQFLTLPEVQSFLGIKSRKTVLKYIKSGELPAYKLGGTRWRITPNDIELFLKKQQVLGNLKAQKTSTNEEKGSIAHGIG